MVYISTEWLHVLHAWNVDTMNMIAVKNIVTLWHSQALVTVFLLQNTKTAELIWPPLAYKSCIVFILKLSILTMLLTLFALFTLQRARRGHPVTPPCLHNCALSAQFYTQPWEPPLHCTWSLHSISTKTWCADPHFSLACGRVYDEWQSNVALQYLSHPCSRFGLSFILLLTVLSVLT